MWNTWRNKADGAFSDGVRENHDPKMERNCGSERDSVRIYEIKRTDAM